MLGKRPRQVKGTFLLHLVACLATIAVLVAVFLVVALTTSVVSATAAKLVAAGVVVVYWVVGIELGLAPALIESYALKRAQRTGKPLSPRWFIDGRGRA